MTQQEIQEKNVEIAKMLGWKTISELEEINEENEHLKDSYFLAHTELVFWSPEILKFNSDWNWLMEAIEFITNYYSCKVLPSVHLLNMSIFTPKEAVFIAVSDFAKLYNEGKL